MKPNSIVQFERLYIASIVVWLILVIMSFENGVAALESAAPGSDLAAGFLAGWYAVILASLFGLWYLIIKQRSAIGKWLLSLWFVVQSCAVAYKLYAGVLAFELAPILDMLNYVLLTWGLSYLFKPDADAWFAKSAPSA